MKTILENPLFRVSPSKGRLPKDPLASFDGLAAAGLVDIQFIVRCLRYHLTLAGKSPASLREYMKRSKAGSKVASWWWSADADARKKLLANPTLTSALFKFMVAEGLQDRIMQWLRMLMEHDLGGHNGQVSADFAWEAFPRLLGDFMIAEKWYGHGLHSVTEYYVQACRMLLSMHDPPYDRQMVTSMRRPGVRLGFWIVDNESNQSREIPAALYDNYIALVSTLLDTPPYLRPQKFLLASLPLYHPTNPNPRPLLNFARDPGPTGPHSWNNAKRQVFIKAGFEAIRILIEKGESRDAMYLTDYVQQLLPKEAPETSKPSTEQDYLLDRLGVDPT